MHGTLQETLFDNIYQIVYMYKVFKHIGEHWDMEGCFNVGRWNSASGIFRYSEMFVSCLWT